VNQACHFELDALSDDLNTVDTVAASVNYPPPPERSTTMTVSVCLCPRAHLWNYKSDLQQLFVPVAVARWSCVQSIPSRLSDTLRADLLQGNQDCGARGPRFESHSGRSCLSRQPLQYAALGTGCAPLLQCLGRLSLLPSVVR